MQLVGLGLLQNIGIYSNRIQRLQDVPEGAKVSVANDPVNQGRGLLLLQKAGLIKLRQGNAVGASVNDVVENPKNCAFTKSKDRNSFTPFRTWIWQLSGRAISSMPAKRTGKPSLAVFGYR